MHTATRRLRSAAPAMFVFFALIAAVTLQSAQANGAVGFSIDHYQIYKMNFPIPAPIGVTLKDQFGSEFVNVVHATRFGVPVDKNGEGILRPDLHNVWWEIQSDNHHPIRHVVVSNQFGDASLEVSVPVYLINPALKNMGVPGDPNFVTENHYKCYVVLGPPALKTVTIGDQYGTDSAFVADPVFLCNPATKTDPDGTEYPPPHPEDHLVCYQILTGQGNPIPVGFTDQFIDQASNELILRDLLCVPSFKEEVVQVEPGSWGKIKSYYR